MRKVLLMLLLCLSGVAQAQLFTPYANGTPGPYRYAKSPLNLWVSGEFRAPSYANGLMRFDDSGKAVPYIMDTLNLNLYRNQDGATAGRALNFYRSSGTYAAPTTVDSGTEFGAVSFHAYDGSNYERVGSISAVAIQDGFLDSIPWKMSFKMDRRLGLFNDGEKMSIDYNGNMTLNSGMLSGKDAEFSSRVRVGNPASIFTGSAPLELVSTSNRTIMIGVGNIAGNIILGGNNNGVAAPEGVTVGGVAFSARTDTGIAGLNANTSGAYIKGFRGDGTTNSFDVGLGLLTADAAGNLQNRMIVWPNGHTTIGYNVDHNDMEDDGRAVFNVIGNTVNSFGEAGIYKDGNRTIQHVIYDNGIMVHRRGLWVCSNSTDTMKIENGKITEYAGLQPADGELLIGKTSTGTFEKTTLTATSPLSLTNGSGAITLALPTYTPTAALYAAASGYPTTDASDYVYNDASNRLGIGTTTLTSVGQVNILGENSGDGSIWATINRAGGTTGATFRGRRSTGTKAIPTATGNNSLLASFEAASFDGTNYTGAIGWLRWTTNQATTAANQGTYATLATTTNGTTTPTDRITVFNTGNVQVISGAATDIPTAILSATSTTKGFLPPRMTATQGSAISSPAEGLMIYVTDTNGTFTAKGWWGYDGAAWQKLNN